ncbi:MAG: hypothetical protein OXR84_05165 [Magnetovibrio sp.]|nr:hypothetical protein [Magnetovibrio sp.]
MSERPVPSWLIAAWLGALAGAALLSGWWQAHVMQAWGYPLEAKHVAGTAFRIFAFSGALPVLWWARRRFRAARGFGPLMLWSVLLAGLGLAGGFGANFL